MRDPRQLRAHLELSLPGGDAVEGEVEHLELGEEGPSKCESPLGVDVVVRHIELQEARERREGL